MATQSIPTGLQTIPLTSIFENINNPRKYFEPVALKELARSIESHGVRQPILVRPDPLGSKKYELIVGARRFRASKLAGKTEVPAIVDVLSDREALEVMVIENQQRQDVSPLEEARGYQALMNLGADNGTAAHTVESIAAKVGKSVGYVYARLKLIALIPAAGEALDQNHITPGHAVLIARLQPLDQVKALLSCFNHHFDAKFAFEPQLGKFADLVPTTYGFEKYDLSLIPEKALREWIQDNVNLKLKGVPWDLLDANLLPEAGACSTCPKRSESNPALFSELTVKGEDTCFDPVCFKEKREAFVKVQLCKDRERLKDTERAQKAAGIEPGEQQVPPDALRQLSEQTGYTKPTPDQRVLKAGQWLPAKKGECDSVEQGLIVRGEHAGEKKLVCCNGACKVHKHHLQAESAGRAQPATEFDRAALEREREFDKAWDKHIVELLRTKVDGPDRAALQLIAECYQWDVALKKKLAKLPLHKAWSLFVQGTIENAVYESPEGLAEFAKANKLDLDKLEKDFRAKHAKTLEVQTSAKPKKGK